MKKVISVLRTLSFFFTNVSVTQLAIYLFELNNKNSRTRREIYSSKQERHQNDSSENNNLVLFLLILNKLFTHSSFPLFDLL